MSTDSQPPIIVENMNIFCTEGKLQLPPHIEEIVLDGDGPQPEEIIEQTEVDETEQAWQTVEMIKDGIKKARSRYPNG